MLNYNIFIYRLLLCYIRGQWSKMLNTKNYKNFLENMKILNDSKRNPSPIFTLF